MNLKEMIKEKLNRKIILTVVGTLLAILLIIIVAKLFSVEESVGNYANMGLAVEKDGVVYYNKYEEGIVKIKGGKESQITDETAYSMNLVGDTIYYLTVSDANTIDIKSVKTNGDKLTKISTIYTAISKIYVEDGYIYYATNRDESALVKMNIETQEEQKLMMGNVQDFVLKDGIIYFTDNTNTLSSITTKGQDLKTIETSGHIKKIQILDQWIYYYDEVENALCKIKEDGSHKKVVSSFIHNEIYNVTSEKIYYYDDINKQISSCDLRGKTSKAIVGVKSTKPKINIVDRTIYYLDDSNNETQIYQMYRIKTNGSDTKSIDY